MTLKFGDRNQEVRTLQRQLNERGATLFVDGHYGPATEAAVRTWQHRTGLVVDGIAGPNTLASLKGYPIKNTLKQKDIIAAAKRLDVPIPVILAVNEVESSGSGFLPNGKPKILFERHVMYRHLCAPHGDISAETRARQADQLAITTPNLVNPRPGGYAGGTAEHQRLKQARQIDDIAALSSTSWGLYQIMGYHWQALGYSSIHNFVDAMHLSEADHLNAFIKFIEADPALHKALKANKWAQFAKLYNGPDYQRNFYDIKLARSFQRHTDANQTSQATV